MADVSLLFNVLVRDNTASGLNSASSNMDKFKRATSVAATASVAGLATIGTATVKSAAEQSAAISAWTQVTGKQMTEREQTIARSLNLSQTDYAKSFTTLSSLYQSNGIKQAEANKMAAAGLKLAADQAAFGNTTVGEAVEAQAGLLKGSGELLEKYAISITAADVAARLKADGNDKLKGAELKAATAAAKAALVQEQSAKFLGQAARESNSLESRQQKLAATIEDMKAKLGAALLPTVEKVIGKFQQFADWVEKNQTKAKILAGVIGGLAGVIIGAAVALKAIAAAQMVARAATAMWTGAMWLLNAAVLANPVVGITVAIVALIAVVVLIAKKTDWFQRLWSAAWGAIKAAALAVWNWLKGAATATWDAIRAAFQKVKDFIVGVWDKIKASAAAVWTAVKDGVTKVKDWIVEKFTAAWQFYVGIGQKIRDVFDKAWSAVKDGVSKAKDFVVGKAKDIIDFYAGIPGKIGDLGNALFDAGVNMIQGFINGIIEKAKDLPGVLKDKVVGVAKGIITSGLGILSPSRVTMQYGKWTAEGFAIGLINGTEKVKNATTEMVDKAKAAAEKRMEAFTSSIQRQVEKMQAAVQKSRDIAKGIRESFTGFADVSGVETGAGFLASVQAKAAQAEAFAKGITALRKAGLNKTTLGQLIAAGPESGFSTVDQLLKSGGIGAVNAAVARIRSAGETLGLREAYAQTGIDPRVQGRAVVGKGKQRVSIDLNLNGSSDDITEAIMKAIRKRVRASGGDVRVVLGTAR